MSRRKASANSTDTTLASSSSGRRYNAGMDASLPGIDRVFLSPVIAGDQLEIMTEENIQSLSVANRAVLTTPLIPGFSLSLSELFKPSV